VALGDVPLAAAVDGGVDGEAEHGVGLGHRALDMGVDPGLIAADVELKHAQRRRRRLRYRFEAGLADRTQHVRDAELMRRPHDRRAAARIKRLQGADRTEHDRQPQPAAEKFDRGIDLAHVAQHART
jgi:hypothetical protein